MDELKKVLQGIGGSMQELENTQRAISRDLDGVRQEVSRGLDAARLKSEDMTIQFGELRGAFAGLAEIVERIWNTQQDHEIRIKALERRAS